MGAQARFPLQYFSFTCSIAKPSKELLSVAFCWQAILSMSLKNDFRCNRWRIVSKQRFASFSNCSFIYFSLKI